MRSKLFKQVFICAALITAFFTDSSASAKCGHKVFQSVPGVPNRSTFVYTGKVEHPRTVTNLDQDWQFTKDEYQPGGDPASVKWDHISLPHTWNKDDVLDDVPGYYRAACWYRKTLMLDQSYRNKKLFLYFNGANQETEVYVNGQKADSHIGGYTRFCVEIDQLIKLGTPNEIAVKVDNKFNESIAPLTADFTFYGGIYRDVNLVATSSTHFDLANAANGVFITTPAVSAARASVKIMGQVVNQGGAGLQVITTVLDNQGRVSGLSKTILANSTGTVQFGQSIPQITNPHLWTPDDPYLYKVISRIVNTQGKVIDEVTNPLGFRWFKFDAEKGFFLNDKHYKLMGANRHQDYEGLGNAVPQNYQAHDIELLKQMGANFIRISHYPQDPIIMETCDKLGILASVEIPVVNTITESDAFTQNCKNMQVEMIRQNFNHPSVIIWAYMNEILLVPKFGSDKPRQQVYFDHIKKLAQTLDSLTRKEDPTRYTMMSCHGSYNSYKSLGLVQIPMITGWNLYQGWYGGKTSEFGPFLDKHHEEFPNQPVIVTEFGADADPRIRALDPVKFDKSVDYAVGFHQDYYKAIAGRPFVAGGAIWNLVDFNSEGRTETMPHMNIKGMLTWGRKPKDVYYFNQAVLQKQPFVKISNWVLRAGVADSLNHAVCTQQVMVFSNAKEVMLNLNGKSMGTKTVSEGIAVWNVPFTNGTNKLESAAAVGGKTYSNQSGIKFNLIPFDLRTADHVNLNILLGAGRYYTDHNQNVWIPAQPYKPGNFGYTGGTVYSMKVNTRLSYGTDRNIIGTDDDPIYQTQQIGIQTFHFDVPPGKYELALHFAELTTDKAKEALAYNLDSGAAKETSQDRAFNVLVNGKLILKNFDAAKKYGSVTAGVEKTIVTVTGNAGIIITFEPLTGEPILNAVQLLSVK